MGGETEPHELPTETNPGPRLVLGPEPRSLVGDRLGSTAKTRGIAGISQTVPECERGVSATADYLAERVGFEPTVPFTVHTLSKRAP